MWLQCYQPDIDSEENFEIEDVSIERLSASLSDHQMLTPEESRQFAELLRKCFPIYEE
jgi:hypothetical protein